MSGSARWSFHSIYTSRFVCCLSVNRLRQARAVLDSEFLLSMVQTSARFFLFVSEGTVMVQLCTCTKRTKLAPPSDCYQTNTEHTRACMLWVGILRNQWKERFQEEEGRKRERNRHKEEEEEEKWSPVFIQCMGETPFGMAYMPPRKEWDITLAILH